MKAIPKAHSKIDRYLFIVSSFEKNDF